MAYVTNFGSGTVTPINTVTNTACRPVNLSGVPNALAITPDGRTAYVTNAISGTLTPVTIATGIADLPITVGERPVRHSHHPRRDQGIRGNDISGTVTPVTTVTNTAGHPIRVGNAPLGIAITPRRGHRLRSRLRFGHRHPDHDRDEQGKPPDRSGSRPVRHRHHLRWCPLVAGRSTSASGLVSGSFLEAKSPCEDSSVGRRADNAIFCVRGERSFSPKEESR